MKRKLIHENGKEQVVTIVPDISGGGGAVNSVNGKTGDVVLDSTDVGALPVGTTIPTKTSQLSNDSGYITSSALPTKVSELQNDSGYLTSETDPTVPSWAKQSSKPTYTASEVGALPSSTVIPSKTSDLQNDSGFISTETDPTVPSWAKQSSKPSYTAQEVGALPSSTSIPSKTSDLTNDSGFITSSALPTKVSDLTNDAGYITGYTETDPTVPSWAKASTKPTYTASEVGALPSTTSIPSKTSDLTNDSGFITSAQVPTYTATSPIDITSNVVSHETSGVTAGTYDGTYTKGYMYFPSITVDAKGHVTSATDLSQKVPVVSDSASSDTNNEFPCFVEPYSYAFGVREATNSIFNYVLSAGSTSKTITINYDSHSSYNCRSFFHIIDVAFYDYTTNERLICDWTTDTNFSNGLSIDITVTIAQAFAHDIIIKPFLSYEIPHH